MRALRRAISAAFFSGVYCPGWSLARPSPRSRGPVCFYTSRVAFSVNGFNSTIGGRTLPKEKAEDRPLSRALWKNWDGPSKKPSGGHPRQDGSSERGELGNHLARCVKTATFENRRL